MGEIEGERGVRKGTGKKEGIEDVMGAFGKRRE